MADGAGRFFLPKQNFSGGLLIRFRAFRKMLKLGER